MKNQPWLLPDVEAEVAEERSAAMREAAQRVRDETRRAKEYLATRDLIWLIDELVDNGPMTEVALMQRAGDLEAGALAFHDLWSLWRTKKLWRKSQGIHPGSGVESFLYGLYPPK